MNDRKKLIGLGIFLCLAGFSLFAEEIHEAVRQGDLARTAALLRENPELVNAKDGEGDSPLHSASGGGHLEIVKYLVTQGADVNGLNSSHQGPLLYASYEGHADVVRYLLDKGADYTVEDRYGRAPLHYAARQGKTAAVGILIEGGADPNLKDGTDLTPIEYAINQGHVQILEFFLEKGMIKPCEDNGRRTLHAVAARGHGNFVKLLLCRGADIHTQGDHGGNLIHSAVKGGLSETVGMLVKKGLDVNAKDSRGRTPLPYAVERNDIGLIKTLIKNEADINTIGNDGRTPLQVAEDWGFNEIATYLRTQGAKQIHRPPVLLKNLSTQIHDAKQTKEVESVEISYIANEGFMIATESKRILVDALFRNPYGYSDTPDEVFDSLLTNRPPFEKIDLILFSHAHRDHFEPEMSKQALLAHYETLLVGNDILCKELQQQAGDDFQRFASRVHNINPEWGTVFLKTFNGIDVTVFPLNHADSGQEYVTLAYVVELNGIRILHLGDNYAPSNIDNFNKYSLEKVEIDVAFIDPFFLLDKDGQKILKTHLKPQIIVPMHMRSEEIEGYAEELKKQYTNLTIFWESMERKTFVKE